MPGQAYKPGMQHGPYDGVLSGWVYTILRALDQEGIALTDALAAAQIDAAPLGNGGQRYSQEDVNRLWRFARQQVPDPAFGLTVAQQVRPDSFHVVGQAMSCSGTPYRALERFSRYCRLLSDAATATLIQRRNHVCLEFYFDMGKRPPIYQSYDTVLASVLHLLRWISHRQIIPQQVSLRHGGKPLDARFREFFVCDIQYGAAQDSICFAKEDLERRIFASDERLATALDECASRDLELRMAGRFTVRVRDALVAQLAEGAPSKRRTASMLHLTERTLLRRLKNEGVTYLGVLKQLREELAFDYLQRGDISLAEVARRLGYSEYSAFSRAFSQWTGNRPRQLD